MAIEKLSTFLDIYTAICNEVKIPLTDEETVTRIKRDINMIYLQEVVPFKQRKWDWLETTHSFTTPVVYETGTITLTKDSTTISFSSAPSGTLTGQLLKIDGHPEIYKMTSNTVINVAWPHATATLAFKLWPDTITLPATFSEVISVTHNRRSSPMDLVNSAKFNEMFSRFPDIQNPPEVCTINARTFKYFPSCNTIPYLINIEGRLIATGLDLDADTPLVPEEDRIVIFYGACSRAWSRERNEGEANRNWNLFMRKLNQMAARSSGASDVTEIATDDRYLRDKRYRRMKRRGHNAFKID